MLLTFNQSQVTCESENKLELCCAFSERAYIRITTWEMVWESRLIE